MATTKRARKLQAVAQYALAYHNYLNTGEIDDLLQTLTTDLDILGDVDFSNSSYIELPAAVRELIEGFEDDGNILGEILWRYKRDENHDLGEVISRMFKLIPRKALTCNKQGYCDLLSDILGIDCPLGLFLYRREQGDLRVDTVLRSLDDLCYDWLPIHCFPLLQAWGIDLSQKLNYTEYRGAVLATLRLYWPEPSQAQAA